MHSVSIVCFHVLTGQGHSLQTQTAGGTGTVLHKEGSCTELVQWCTWCEICCMGCKKTLIKEISNIKTSREHHEEIHLSLSLISWIMVSWRAYIPLATQVGLGYCKAAELHVAIQASR